MKEYLNFLVAEELLLKGSSGSILGSGMARIFAKSNCLAVSSETSMVRFSLER